MNLTSSRHTRNHLTCSGTGTHCLGRAKLLSTCYTPTQWYMDQLA